MKRLRPLKPQEVIKILEKLDYRQRRQTGSHVVLKNNQTGKIIPVPVHKGRNLKLGTLRAIIRQTGIGTEEFFNLLK